ncbi:S8 family serine peptidase [Nonomuraea spiralis]|uniref:S8 family serine peptidase n=1 Tax=Nonomuraea spiralis TaxID=46182 RepID=A0ABV5IXD4_9ACTN|nr:S8 family serine peptidase [Nonomuraea spiralis]
MAAVLAGTLGVTPGAGAAGQANQEGPGEPRPGTSASVTLLTGDRVVVTGKSFRVEPGAAREVHFSSGYRDGHLYVVPSDAAPLVAQGVLDERLFDVTQLLAWRYGDADTADIPLITQAPEGTAPALKGAATTRRLTGLGMTAQRVAKKSAGEAWRSLVGGVSTLAAGKGRIWLDGRRSYTLDRSTKQIGATEAWQRGFTGQGVTVAVLDSGYDPTHPDLKDVVTQSRNFSDEPDITDRVGHGTHVTSIVAGAGEKYRGVAPGARVAFGKLGSVPTDSAILAGMEWAAKEVKAKIVNLSLGGPDEPGLDPLEQAVNTLSQDTGTLFVVAAGNEGESGVSSPGSADAALTVGAVDRSDQVAAFSSRGPRIGDHAVKPDLTAPGVDIVAAAAAGTADGTHVAMSGTSMATPHMVGAAAILAQRHPDWSGQQLKAALVGSARPTDGATPYQQGTGRVDVLRSLAQEVIAAPSGVWATFPWQQAGGRRVTGKITYTNTGAAPVTLDLADDSDVLTLSPQRLEVPAGGQASVTVTIDAEGRSPGDYPGVVTATAGDTVVRTPAGAYVEPESYDVTVTVLGRDGAATDMVRSLVYDQATGRQRDLVFHGNVATMRLPKGRWNLYTEISGMGDHTLTFAHQPFEIDDADVSLTVDGSKAKRITFTVDDPTAVPDRVFSLSAVNGPWSTMLTAYNFSGGFYVLPVRQPGFAYLAQSVWTKKDTKPSPYRYDLVDYRTDGFPDNPGYAARTREMVKATETYRSTVPGATGMLNAGPMLPGGVPSAGVSTWDDIPLPSRLTRYLTPGFAWYDEFSTGGLIELGTGPVRDRNFTQVWNAAVTDPSFAVSGGSRTGDTLDFPADGLYSSGAAGRTGMDATATGTLTLAGNGKEIATTGIAGCLPYRSEQCTLTAALPSSDTAYTLTASSRRPEAELSTGVDAVWTFRSARTAKPEPLPLMAVRYTPQDLDDDNRAKPGSRTTVPIRVERAPGAARAAVSSIKLEASADDGRTWRPVRVQATRSGWTARLDNPTTPGYVSLRATVTDKAGNGVTQTVTRAYSVG